MEIPEKTIINQANYNQDLTFKIFKSNYGEMGFEINDKMFFKNFSLLTKDSEYNRLAGLLANITDVSIKVVRFAGTTKSSLTGQPRRIDKKLVNPKCLREALLNAVAHNNWINNIPPAVYVFSDRIEIQSNVDFQRA